MSIQRKFLEYLRKPSDKQIDKLIDRFYSELDDKTKVIRHDSGYIVNIVAQYHHNYTCDVSIRYVGDRTEFISNITSIDVDLLHQVREDTFARQCQNIKSRAHKTRDIITGEYK